MIHETIEDYINEFSPELIPILQTTSIVISGSAVLYYKMKQLGMTPNFIPKDLDLFMIHKGKNNGYSELNQWFDKTFHDMTDFEKTQFEISIYSGDPMYYNDYEFVRQNVPEQLSNIIRHIRSGLKLNSFGEQMRIDCILINECYEKTPIDFIEEHFDFDFCKCWYDGNEIKCNHENDIINKICIFKNFPMASYINVDPVVLIKYIANIKSNNFPKELTTHNDPLRIYRRVTKYRNRGFKIITSQLVLDAKYLKQAFEKKLMKTLIDDVELIRNEGINLWVECGDFNIKIKTAPYGGKEIKEFYKTTVTDNHYLYGENNDISEIIDKDINSQFTVDDLPQYKA